MICLFCMNSLLEGFVRRYPTRIPMAKCTTATGRLPSSTSSCRLSSNCGNHLDCSPALFNAIAPPSPLMTGINSKCKKDNLQTIRFLFCQILSCSTWWNGMGSLGHWYLREMDPPPWPHVFAFVLFFPVFNMASMHFPKLRHCPTQNLQLVKAETPKCIEDTLGRGGGPFPLCIKDPGARGQLSFSFLKILLKTSHHLF